MTQRDDWYFEDDEIKPAKKVWHPPTGYQRDAPKEKGESFQDRVKQTDDKLRRQAIARFVGACVTVIICAVVIWIFRPR